MEKYIVNAILKYLNGLPRCKAIKVHGSVFMEKGTPDIIGCWARVCFLIEVKQPGKEPSDIQKYRMTQWENAEALVLTVTSLAEVKEIFDLEALTDLII
jgi:hypothetical protein